jgi:hypothetical protein
MQDKDTKLSERSNGFHHLMFSLKLSNMSKKISPEEIKHS